jgi:hypothetical protein
VIRSRAQELLEELQDYQDQILRENETYLAPGVFGITAKDLVDGNVIVWLRAAEEGKGDVGRYLDSLEGTVRVIAPNERLDAMLDRRGYKKCQIWGAGAERSYPGRVRRA